MKKTVLLTISVLILFSSQLHGQWGITSNEREAFKLVKSHKYEEAKEVYNNADFLVPELIHKEVFLSACDKAITGEVDDKTMEFFAKGCETLLETKFKKACPIFDEAIFRKNDFTEAYYFKGLAEQFTGMSNGVYKNGEKTFERILLIDPAHQFALEELRKIYILEENYEQIIEKYSLANQFNPNNPDIISKLIGTYLYLNKTDKIIEIIKDQLNQGRLQFLLTKRLYQIYLYRNQFETARNILDENPRIFTRKEFDHFAEYSPITLKNGMDYKSIYEAFAQNANTFYDSKLLLVPKPRSFMDKDEFAVLFDLCKYYEMPGYGREIFKSESEGDRNSYSFTVVSYGVTTAHNLLEVSNNHTLFKTLNISHRIDFNKGAIAFSIDARGIELLSDKSGHLNTFTYNDSKERALFYNSRKAARKKHSTDIPYSDLQDFRIVHTDRLEDLQTTFAEYSHLLDYERIRYYGNVFLGNSRLKNFPASEIRGIVTDLDDSEAKFGIGGQIGLGFSIPVTKRIEVRNEFNLNIEDPSLRFEYYFQINNFEISPKLVFTVLELPAYHFYVFGGGEYNRILNITLKSDLSDFEETFDVTESSSKNIFGLQYGVGVKSGPPFIYAHNSKAFAFIEIGSSYSPSFLIDGIESSYNTFIAFKLGLGFY